MNLYAFELGRKKHLCFAELIAVLGEKSLAELNYDTAIFKLTNLSVEEAGNLQNRLGGTIKIIEISDRLLSIQENKLKESIKKILENYFKDRSGKIPFSISIL
ncbi:hypothetical protein GF366_04065, partial [Candidatus Peregrinibacteria bacterium]|nr:hypothetical protein [Candidatus Peregrinibacteria bacterium]